MEGRLDSPNVTVELATPRREKAGRLYVGAAMASGNPPDPGLRFQVDASTDAGKSWQPVVKDWHVVRRAPEAPDFFALGTLWGEVELKDVEGPVRARFSNTAGRPFLRVEEHLVYKVRKQGPTEVTFAWKEAGGPLKTGSHTYAPSDKEDSSWTIRTGRDVSTIWVEESAKQGPTRPRGPGPSRLRTLLHIHTPRRPRNHDGTELALPPHSIFWRNS